MMRKRTMWESANANLNKYLTITALEDGFVDFNICDSDGNYGISTDYLTSVSYSTDGGSTWTTYQNTGDVIIIEVYLYEGQQVLFKGIANCYCDFNSGANGHFNLNTTCSVSGNIMSLLYGDNFAGQTSLPNTGVVGGTFTGLFVRCTNITDISDLVLPATTLSPYCYMGMFYGTGITSIPENFLPATTLAIGCYNGMFANCASLTTVPSNLLPATTLAEGCYEGMFQNCTSLTTAPELPATTLASGCYNGMFYGSTSLNYIKCLATDISADNCTTAWLQNVAASGTFVKAASMSSWTTGASGIPSGWTVQNAS